jgi:hypothetical protein
MQIEHAPIWWEKTVEYTYLSLLPKGHVIAPLAGNFERAGDALLRWDEYNWFLIEFKRDKPSFISENKKYLNEDGYFHEQLYTLLEQVANGRHDGNPEPHYLVYASGVQNGRLMLHADRYWGPWCKQDMFTIEPAPSQDLQTNSVLTGVERYLFADYLLALMDAKSGGTGSVSSGAFGVVMGIAKAGDDVVSISLDDYVTEHHLAIVDEPSPFEGNTHTPDRPGM